MERKIVPNGGFALHSNLEYERSINIRYVDDVIMFAKSVDEAQRMIELLVQRVCRMWIRTKCEENKNLQHNHDKYATNITNY